MPEVIIIIKYVGTSKNKRIEGIIQSPIVINTVVLAFLVKPMIFAQQDASEGIQPQQQ